MTKQDRQIIKNFLESYKQLESVKNHHIRNIIHRIEESFPDTTITNVLKELSERATGRSTRLVDEYIQELFNDGQIIVEDHYGTLESNRFLFDRITTRLSQEHRGVKFNYDRTRCSIRLVKIYD